MQSDNFSVACEVLLKIMDDSKSQRNNTVRNVSTFIGEDCILVLWMSSLHYSDVIMGTIASQITSLTIVYSTVYSDADLRKHQSSASLAFVREIHRGPVNSPHNWPVTRKMFPFDDVIMCVETIKCVVFIFGWSPESVAESSTFKTN